MGTRFSSLSGSVDKEVLCEDGNYKVKTLSLKSWKLWRDWS